MVPWVQFKIGLTKLRELFLFIMGSCSCSPELLYGLTTIRSCSSSSTIITSSSTIITP